MRSTYHRGMHSVYKSLLRSLENHNPSSLPLITFFHRIIVLEVRPPVSLHVCMILHTDSFLSYSSIKTMAERQRRAGPSSLIAAIDITSNISHPNIETRIGRVTNFGLLPIELILEIFQLCVASSSSSRPDDLRHVPLQGLPHASRMDALVSVSQVSTRWRPIALERRRLWIEVHLHWRVTRGTSDAERMMAALTVFVDRSGTHPLCTYSIVRLQD